MAIRMNSESVMRLLRSPVVERVWDGHYCARSDRDASNGRTISRISTRSPGARISDRFDCDRGLALRIVRQLSQRGIGSVRSWWRLFVPLVVWLILASIPCPAGLTPAGWRYHALFVGVVVALILEPFP